MNAQKVVSASLNLRNILVGVVAFCAIAVYWRDRARLNARLDATDRRFKAVQAALTELNELQRAAPQIVKIVRAPALAAPSGTASGEGGRASAAGGAGGEGAGEEEADTRPEERGQVIATSFAAEGYDAAWAQSQKVDIERRLAEPKLQGSQVRSVECRSTMCKVELFHEDAAAAEAFGFEGLHPNDRPWAGGFYYQPDPPGPDGSSTARLFVMREGVGLPIPNR